MGVQCGGANAKKSTICTKLNNIAADKIMQSYNKFYLTNRIDYDILNMVFLTARVLGCYEHLHYLKEEIPMKVDRNTVTFILKLLANMAKAVIEVLEEYPDSE